MRPEVLRSWIAVLALALTATAVSAQAEDQLVYAEAGILGEERHVGAWSDHEVLVDAAARRAGQAGLPVESDEGDVVLLVGDGAAVDPSIRPGAVRVDNRALHPVLPDGTTVPAGSSAAPVWLEAGLDRDGRGAITLGAASSTSRSQAAESAASAASYAGSLAATGASSATPSVGRLPQAVASLVPDFGDPVRAKTVRGSDGSTVTPSAIAMTPVEGSHAAAVAAAGAVALGALIALWPLYHRLQGHRTLESASRKRIYDLVCEKPGVGVAELAKTAGVSYSTATYHLDRLVEAGVIVSSNAGAKLRYYKNGGFNESDRALVPVLENKEAMRLLDLIRQNPGTYRAALADALNVTTTTINWHLKRLTAAGLVREERRGRSAHLFAVEERLQADIRPLAERLSAASA